MAVDLLNPNLGISTLLPEAPLHHLPETDDYSSVGRNLDLSALQEYKLSLSGHGFERTISQSFIPKVASDELLRPAVFNNLLQSAAGKLAASDDPKLRRFVREDLAPLEQNKELLQAYLGLMMEA
ncbi:MAG: hypothetical protein IAB19_08030 [Proteobacteria bacterium]|uniref:Uncharacterized protein n=1 Tax=Candidatus Avisuccinivibrio stercorigallinarum TaxID=2840704 RepID=A0A9D9DDB6_9GAMM|nr:hypothetical protein [Candidatus Avisuccinivibrio stercorigallinarum]